MGPGRLGCGVTLSPSCLILSCFCVSSFVPDSNEDTAMAFLFIWVTSPSWSASVLGRVHKHITHIECKAAAFSLTHILTLLLFPQPFCFCPLRCSCCGTAQRVRAPTSSTPYLTQYLNLFYSAQASAANTEQLGSVQAQENITLQKHKYDVSFFKSAILKYATKSIQAAGGQRLSAIVSFSQLSSELFSPSSGGWFQQ